MLIQDHINITGKNPLMGENDERLGPRFPDMSEAYDPKLRAALLEAARLENIDIRRGVYVGLTGPSYETPSEVRMVRVLGGDACGMSTVLEIIAANHAGMRSVGVSCISNMAAGILPEKLTHEDVLKTTELVREKFIRLVRRAVTLLSAA